MTLKEGVVGQTSEVRKGGVVISPISKVVFGLRFGPLYQLGDALGAIVDDILRAPGTPFGPLVFPLSQKGLTTHVLHHNSRGDSLSITERDIVLTMAGSETLEQVDRLGEQFNAFVLGAVKRHMTMRMVSRYGMILELADVRSELRTSLMREYLGDDSDAHDISLRYSRRLQTEEAHFRKGVNDFRNLIFTLQQDQESALISLDYQLYLDPALDSEDWKKKPFDQFVRSGTSYASSSFDAWLSRLLKSPQVA
jgi:hypothetical protein